MKKLFFLILIGAIFSCNSNQSSYSASADSAKMADSGKKIASSTSINDTVNSKSTGGSSSSWSYNTDTDKMTSKLNFFATVNSTNTLNFAAPYDGGSTATITLRNKANKNEVILSIDKGQFICDVSEGCTIKVRFDQTPAIKMSANEPSDYSSTTLFIESGPKFIARAKKAKKVIIQAEFYEEGLQDMEFDINDLKWAH